MASNYPLDDDRVREQVVESGVDCHEATEGTYTTAVDFMPAAVYDTAETQSIPGVSTVTVNSDQEVVSDRSLSVLGCTYIVQGYHDPWWKGCCCRVQHQRAVLQNVSMHLRAGEVTGIMGNSGSGKTSLLDVISGRTSGQVVGGVYLDNQLMTLGLFKAEAAYVQQDDHLLPNLTVKETLTFTAKLKFAQLKFDNRIINERVNDVIAEMGLRHIADSRIGGSIERGISGGEMRRVSIAVQLLQDPTVLLLDEPTSGLDSFTAYYLLQGLSELAKKKNKIILMTIHQPRSDIFRLLDNVGILSMGEVVYMGPSTQLVPHFTNLGFPCPTYSNPLDYYLDLASVDRRSREYEEISSQRVMSLKKAHVHSNMFRDNLMNINNATRWVDPHVVLSEKPWHSLSNPPGFYFVFSTLLIRMMVNLYRDRSSFFMRCLQLSALSFFMWLYLFELQHNQESIQDRIGIFYQSLQGTAYCGLLNCIALFPSLRDLYYREARDGHYSSLVFLLAYFIHILPFTILSSIIFAVIVYWPLGFNPEFSRFAIYTSVVLIMHYTGEIMGVIFVGVVHTVSVANSTTALVLAVTGTISTGFLRTIHNMIDFLQYLGYFSIFKYTSEIVMAIEFHDLELYCKNESNVPCVFTTGDQYLDLYYPDAVENLTRNCIVSGIFVVGFILIAIITFRVRGIYNLR